MEEIFKDIPNYEGLYQVSNLGNVKSLPRIVCNKRRCYISKEKILKTSIGNHGYYRVIFTKENEIKNYLVHQLVAIAFLDHSCCGYKFVVDHINENKLDNKVENLRIVTNRENVHRNRDNYSSQYKGVSWDKKLNKWSSQIQINGKKIRLGSFLYEYEAHLKYQEALQNIK